MGRRGKSERNRAEPRGPQKLSCRFRPGELPWAFQASSISVATIRNKFAKLKNSRM